MTNDGRGFERITLIVLDSLGMGEMPGAAAWGDAWPEELLDGGGETPEAPAPEPESKLPAKFDPKTCSAYLGAVSSTGGAHAKTLKMHGTASAWTTCAAAASGGPSRSPAASGSAPARPTIGCGPLRRARSRSCLTFATRSASGTRSRPRPPRSRVP